jgi:hypothetical protein
MPDWPFSPFNFRWVITSTWAGRPARRRPRESASCDESPAITWASASTDAIGNRRALPWLMTQAEPSKMTSSPSRRIILDSGESIRPGRVFDKDGQLDGASHDAPFLAAGIHQLAAGLAAFGWSDVERRGPEHRDCAQARRSVGLYSGRRPKLSKIGPPPTQAYLANVLAATWNPFCARNSADSRRVRR